MLSRMRLLTPIAKVTDSSAGMSMDSDVGHAFMNNGNHEDIRKKMESGGLPIGNKASQVMSSPTVTP